MLSKWSRNRPFLCYRVDNSPPQYFGEGLGVGLKAEILKSPAMKIPSPAPNLPIKGIARRNNLLFGGRAGNNE
jgi:hypothetical protein